MIRVKIVRVLPDGTKVGPEGSAGVEQDEADTDAEGGEPTENGCDDESGGGDEPGVEPDEYDPSEHTVEDVLAYAGEHPEAVEAIVNAEIAGKQRTTLLSALAAQG